LYGLKFTTAVESGIITSTIPAVLGLISFVFLKEQWTWSKGIGIVFTLLRHSPSTWLGQALVLSVALTLCQVIYWSWEFGFVARNSLQTRDGQAITSEGM
jgi:drug/metabolite transporter (DMT)-like permease